MEIYLIIHITHLHVTVGEHEHSNMHFSSYSSPFVRAGFKAGEMRVISWKVLSETEVQWFHIDNLGLWQQCDTNNLH